MLRQICVIGASAIVLISCAKNVDHAEYVRDLKADSIQAIATADSLFALADTVYGPGQILKQPSIRKSTKESYRLTAEFSFGQSPVGPLLSVMAREEDSGYVLVTITYPERERKRTETVKGMSREDFMRIRHYFDSVNFQQMPSLIRTDYQVLDASQYYVEAVRDGVYHRISRTKPIERTVYDLWADVLTVAKLDPKLIEMFRQMSRSNQ